MKGRWCSSIGLLLLGDCSIELIEETEDNQREGYWIHHLDCVNQLRLDPVANRERRMARCIAYYAANREQHRASTKQWYEANREQQRARSIERIVCNLCGTESARGDIRRHQKTKKCKRLSKERSGC